MSAPSKELSHFWSLALGQQLAKAHLAGRDVKAGNLTDVTCVEKECCT